MKPKGSAKENMVQDFSTFSMQPDGTQPELAEVKQQLQSEGHRYAIFVRDETGGSHMAVSMFDAETEEFSVLKIGPDTRLSDILEIKEIMMTISEPNAPGIIIVKEGEAKGVLTTETLKKYFSQQSFTVRTRTLGDWSLHGVIKVEAYKIKCAHEGCGAINIVEGFDPGRTRCVNGHILEVESE